MFHHFLKTQAAAAKITALCAMPSIAPDFQEPNGGELKCQDDNRKRSSLPSQGQQTPRYRVCIFSPWHLIQTAFTDVNTQETT